MTVQKEYKVNQLRVMIFDSRQSMGREAGNQVADCIRKLLNVKEEINIIFAAAPSQNETLSSLLEEKDIDWGRVNAYHMDEYVGLEATHPAGFRNYLLRTFFNHVPLKTVNFIDGNAVDAKAEAQRYGILLNARQADICLLGIGENGHLAFNDPPVADFYDSVFAKVVKLEEKCRLQQVHDGCFSLVEEVPKYAITVTVPGLMAARYMFCSVPGATKAEAVRGMLSGNISECCPASILTTKQDAVLYLDKESAEYLL